MKEISILILLTLFSLTLTAQSEVARSSNNSFKYQLGTDISPLFKNLFKSELSANSLLNVPYVLIFKSIKNDMAFRFGIGANFKQEISNDNSKDKVLQNSFRVRLGFEKQRKISKRWQINTGLDIKFSSTKFDDNFNNSLNNHSKNYGIAPLLGIQFQITPQLFLQTEAAFNLYYRTHTNKSSFDIIFPNPFPSTSSKSFKSFDGNITTPNALLMVIQF